MVRKNFGRKKIET